MLALLGPRRCRICCITEWLSSRATRKELSKESVWVPGYFTAALPPLPHTSPLVLVSESTSGVWVYVCMDCVHTHAEARGQYQVCSAVTPYLVFWDNVSHWTQNSLSRFVWLPSVPLRSLPHAKVIDVHQLALFLLGNWGFKLWFSCLHNKRCTEQSSDF